jgi:hypothetical protein
MFMQKSNYLKGKNFRRNPKKHNKNVRVSTPNKHHNKNIVLNKVQSKDVQSKDVETIEEPEYKGVVWWVLNNPQKCELQFTCNINKDENRDNNGKIISIFFDSYDNVTLDVN